MSQNQQFNEINTIKIDEFQSLGRLLLVLFKEFEKEMLTFLHSKNFSDITMTDFQILQFIEPNGSYAMDIGKMTGVTKQAVGKSIKSLVTKKYLTQLSTKQDARLKLILRTRKGERLLKEGFSIIKYVESNYENCISKVAFLQLKANLRKLIEYHPIQK